MLLLWLMFQVKEKGNARQLRKSVKERRHMSGIWLFLIFLVGQFLLRYLVCMFFYALWMKIDWRNWTKAKGKSNDIFSYLYTYKISENNGGKEIKRRNNSYTIYFGRFLNLFSQAIFTRLIKSFGWKMHYYFVTL